MVPAQAAAPGTPGPQATAIEGDVNYLYLGTAMEVLSCFWCDVQLGDGNVGLVGNKAFRKSYSNLNITVGFDFASKLFKK